VYDVDPDTYEIMDAKIYRADINDPSYQISRTPFPFPLSGCSLPLLN